MRFGRRQTVSSDLWIAVVDRDARAIHGASGSTLGFGPWYQQNPLVCIVALLDPSASVRCSGRTTVDHVKDAPMMGRRAPSDMGHLVALCEWHNVIHPPSKELRMKEREYLGL